MKYSVKKGDNVLVIAGKDAGKTGEILEINRETNRVVVANVNIQAHHKKPRNKDDKGGIIKSEGAIDLSNVQVVCPTCKKATRVSRSEIDGKTVRICKKCGASLDVAKKAVKTTKSAKKDSAKEVKTEEKAETKAKSNKKADSEKTTAKKTTTKKTASSSKNS